MFSGKVVNGRVAVGITGRISGGMWLLLEVKFLCLFLLLTIPLCLCVCACIMNRYSLSQVRLSICLFASVISQYAGMNRQAASVCHIVPQELQQVTKP